MYKGERVDPVGWCRQTLALFLGARGREIHTGGEGQLTRCQCAPSPDIPEGLYRENREEENDGEDSTRKQGYAKEV